MLAHAQPQDVVQMHIRSPKSFPARKRRKLTAAAAATDSAGKPTEGRRPSIPLGSPTAQQCMSCHRSHPAGGVVLCGLCRSPTCLICARQCTTAPPPASAPPTPRLSNSPTPPATPARDTLPLPLAPGEHVHVHIATPLDRESDAADLRRRRKHCEDHDDHDDGDEDGTDTEGGCGRTLCNECCIENDITHGNTCLVCYGVLPHPSGQLIPNA